MSTITSRAGGTMPKGWDAAIKEGNISKINDLVRQNRHLLHRWSGVVHSALEQGASVKVIRLLARKFPQDLQMSLGGYLPLQRAVVKRRWDVVQLLMDDKATGKDGSLPFHCAVSDGPLHVLQLLVSKYPESVRLKGVGGWLPLHLAVTEGRPLDVVKFLFDSYEDGIRVKCHGGLMPLHCAAINGAKLEVVRFLADLYPEALLEETSQGLSPLHYAALYSRLQVVQFLARKAPRALVRKTSAGFLPLQQAVKNEAQKEEVVEFLAKMSGACRVIIPFLAQIARARRQRRLLEQVAKLQALSRRFLVHKEYKDVIRSRVQYKRIWSGVVTEAWQKVETDSSWSLLRERHCDMERQVQVDLFRKLDEAMLECSAKENVPTNGEGANYVTSGDDPRFARQAGKDVTLLDNKDEDDDNDDDGDKFLPFGDFESSLPSPLTVTNRVLLTNAALKWSRVSDPRYVKFFVRRIQQLASGQRSRILAKRLTGGFKEAIFETYLEQKSGHRILWTVEALGEVLVWNVVKHKDVSRFARLIGSSLSRTNRQLSDALSTLGIAAVVENASSHADAIVLDPMGNTPLKLYTIEAAHVRKLADKSWTPPLRLTPEERAVVESTGTTLVLGRSGTGKTICLCNKIDFDRHLSSADNSFTQLFVSRSDRLCRFVKKAVDSENCSFTTFNALLSKLECAFSTQVKFQSSQRVDFERFKRDFYRDSKLWGEVDALVAWTNIRSFIKGSIDALSSPNRVLSQVDYSSVEKLGKKRCRLSPDTRHEVYKAFGAYSKYLAENGLWDDCDRISRVLESLQDMKAKDPEGFERLRYSKLYVDECQDFTQAEILLFFYLSRSGDLFLCGDPAQSVVEGVQFRFKEIRSVAHVVAGTDRRHLIPEKPTTVNVNYRSHSGIMNMAAAILKRMFAVFPDAADQLDRGIFRGPRPGLVYKVKVDLLRGALLSVLSGSTVLVHDEHETSCKQDLGGYKQLYGIREAKGLEFTSVIVLDFFSGIPQALQKPWRDLLLGREGLDFAPRFPEVEGHLKLLYTAITRSVDRLLFVESKESVAGDAFSRWSTTTTRVQPRDEEPLAVMQEISEIEAFEMSVDEWMLAGFDSAETAEAKEDLESSISFFDAAVHCFQKAGDSRFIAKAQANLDSVRFRFQMRLCVENRGDASPANMTEQAMAELLSRLLREELWVEAAKFCHAALPRLSEYTQDKLRENVLSKLPKV